MGIYIREEEGIENCDQKRNEGNAEFKNWEKSKIQPLLMNDDRLRYYPVLRSYRATAFASQSLAFNGLLFTIENTLIWASDVTF